MNAMAGDVMAPACTRTPRQGQSEDTIVGKQLASKQGILHADSLTFTAA